MSNARNRRNANASDTSATQQTTSANTGTQDPPVANNATAPKANVFYSLGEYQALKAAFPNKIKTQGEGGVPFVMPKGEKGTAIITVVDGKIVLLEKPEKWVNGVPSRETVLKPYVKVEPLEFTKLDGEEDAQWKNTNNWGQFLHPVSDATEEHLIPETELECLVQFAGEIVWSKFVGLAE